NPQDAGRQGRRHRAPGVPRRGPRAGEAGQPARRLSQGGGVPGRRPQAVEPEVLQATEPKDSKYRKFLRRSPFSHVVTGGGGSTDVLSLSSTGGEAAQCQSSRTSRRFIASPMRVPVNSA